MEDHEKILPRFRKFCFLPEASLQCTKGLGRLSMLFFGVLWTYHNKDDVLINEEVKKDFVRWVWALTHCYSTPSSNAIAQCKYESLASGHSTILIPKYLTEVLVAETLIITQIICQNIPQIIPTARLFARLSPRLSARLSPRLSARLSPRLSARLSPRLSARISSRLSARLSPSAAYLPYYLPDYLQAYLVVNCQSGGELLFQKFVRRVNLGVNSWSKSSPPESIWG